MKLGFAIPIVGSAVSSAAGLSAFCRGLEDLGYDTLWVGIDWSHRLICIAPIRAKSSRTRRR
jgi:hypothetical protein